MGGIRTTGEEAFYAFFVKEDGDCRLVRLVVLHMDDFKTVGTEEFRKNTTDQLQSMYVFGKVETRQYIFTGVDIKERMCDDAICIARMIRDIC